MTKLEYTFKHDTLFKMLFVKYPHLLKRLIAELLNIQESSIEQFEITNPEIPPELIGDKFCRLDINMKVDGQRIDLEIQVADESDYKERSLYYWAREYSSALREGGYYRELPRVVIISIIAFKLFDCDDFHSEFSLLEITRHTPLTDKQSLHYFELSKLPNEINANDGLKLWLSLFKADTEEELKRIEEMEVPIMQQAIEAYRSVSVSPEFREIERMRSKARHDEAQALYHAEKVAAERERAKWEVVVADKDAKLADKDAKLADNAAKLADNAAKLADNAAEIARLRAMLGEKT